MTAILTIDAAWTVKLPSGVALLVNVGGCWRCAGLAPSYQQFEKLADGESVHWDLKPTGRRPDLDRLLVVCRQLLDGEQVSLIAMDMPLSLEPIIRRRAADNAVSRAFGKQGCADHSLPLACRLVHLGCLRACPADSRLRRQFREMVHSLRRKRRVCVTAMRIVNALAGCNRCTASESCRNGALAAGWCPDFPARVFP